MANTITRPDEKAGFPGNRRFAGGNPNPDGGLERERWGLADYLAAAGYKVIAWDARLDEGRLAPVIQFGQPVSGEERGLLKKILRRFAEEHPQSPRPEVVITTVKAGWAGRVILSLADEGGC